VSPDASSKLPFYSLKSASLLSGLALANAGHAVEVITAHSKIHPDDTLTLERIFYGGSQEQLSGGDITAPVV
jgi:hypothetical protein